MYSDRVGDETHVGQDTYITTRDLAFTRSDATDAWGREGAGPLAWRATHDQVVVGDIPQQPSGFQPRSALLAQLNRAGRGVSVLTGTRGVGKTQLAAAYARAKLAAGWRVVAWINTEDTSSLLAGLAAIADAAELSDGRSGRDMADAGRRVRHRLEADGDRCLLVFDDAKDPELLEPFVPVGGAARVVITTARQSVANLGTAVPVGVYSHDEALAVLTGRTGLADEEAAAAVAAELGHLPLALAQAGAVIADQHLGYGGYLERLRALSAEEHLVGEEVPQDPPGAAGAVLLSLEAVRAADQAGVCIQVMEIMAVLSAAGVRRELLHAAGQVGLLASGGHRMTAASVDRALAQLAERSLLTFSIDDQAIIVHPLVTQVVRDGIVRRERLTAVCRAAASALEARARALVGSQDRRAVRDIPEWVAALLESTAGLTGQDDEKLAAVLLRLRFFQLYHLIRLGESAPQAVAVGKQLTADLERTLGCDHPDTLTSQNNLAAAYQLAGQPTVAIPLFEATLAAREEVLGPDHPSTLTSRASLATAYRDAGRPAEAIPLVELTLAARERALGPDHPDTMRSRHNLANAYRQAGRLAEAIPLVEQILAVQERLLGADHSRTLGSRNNLAVGYRGVGRVAEAISLFEQNLAACERLLGAQHPRTLASRNSLAAAYRDAGRVAEAIPLFEHTLAAQEQLLGADHPDTLTARNNLVLAYQEAARTK